MLTSVELAVSDILVTTVISGKLALKLRLLFLVQVTELEPMTLVLQVQPVPVGILASVKPTGKVSETVVVPLIVFIPAFMTLRVKVAKPPA